MTVFMAYHTQNSSSSLHNFLKRQSDKQEVSANKNMFMVALKTAKIFHCLSAPTIYQRQLRGIASKLIYSEYGEPVKVLHKEIEDEKVLEPDAKQILVKMLAAPVNPVDINTIEGKYPSKPPLPAVPGHEGVGIVEKVGPEVVEVKEGDHVVPLPGSLGTWRTHVVMPCDKVLKVPQDLGLVEAATLTINPCTAYRMLKDFVALKPGDVVIQNGANSACGQNIIQISRSWGLKTVNVIRNRPDLDKVKSFLKELGATEVLTEEELRSTDIFKTGKMELPKLALNCIGGKSASELVRHLEDTSMLVTYGGMSREPVYIPTSALIFKDIEVRGFWVSRWFNEHADSVEKIEMFEELISMMENKDLRGPVCEMVKFDNYIEALQNTMTPKGMTGKKFILDFTL